MTSTVVALGVTKKDDKLPKRFKEIPRVRHGTEHTAAIVDKALPEYYKLRGWTDDGKPTKERLRELGIMPGLASETPVGSFGS